MRHGITPVIAILMLLMMSVAAGGAAFIWMGQLQGDVQQQTAQDVQSRTTTAVEIINLICYNRGGDGWVEAILANSGNTPLDLNPVTMNVRRASDAGLNTTTSVTGLSLHEDDIDMSLTTTNLAQQKVFLYTPTDIDQPGDRGLYNITTDKKPGDGGSSDILQLDQFTLGNEYIIEFVFSDENSYTTTGQCEPYLNNDP